MLITIYTFALKLSRVLSLTAILLSAITILITKLRLLISFVKLRPSMLILLLLRIKTFLKHPCFLT